MTDSRKQIDDLSTGGTKNALDLADALDAGCFHITSSIAVSGSFRGRFTEDMFCEGQEFPSANHRTKYESEKVVRDAATMPWRVYRPAIVVGDSQAGRIDKIDGPCYFFRCSNVCATTCRGGCRWSVPLWATPTSSRSTTSTRRCFLAHKPGQDGKVFPLVNPKSQSNLQVINGFAKATKSPRMSISLDKRVTDLLPKRLLSGVLAQIGLPAVDDPLATVAALAGSGIVVPKLPTYSSLLWDYWEQNLDPDIRSDKGMRSLRLSSDRFHDFERIMALNYFGAIRLIGSEAPRRRLAL